MMDPSLLPARALIDTGVLIRALRQKDDAFTEDCFEFVEAMIQENNRVLIAAPTLAEVLRGDPSTKLPATEHVQVVPFDRKSAEVLGNDMHIQVQKVKAAETGLPVTYVKYDAMIMACAAAFGAKAVISLDKDHRKLARYVNILCRTPADFRARQGELQLVKR